MMVRVTVILMIFLLFSETINGEIIRRGVGKDINLQSVAADLTISPAGWSGYGLYEKVKFTI